MVTRPGQCQRCVGEWESAEGVFIAVFSYYFRVYSVLTAGTKTRIRKGPRVWGRGGQDSTCSLYRMKRKFPETTMGNEEKYL